MYRQQGDRRSAGNSQEQSGLSVGKVLNPFLDKKALFFFIYEQMNLCVL